METSRYEVLKLELINAYKLHLTYFPFGEEHVAQQRRIDEIKAEMRKIDESVGNWHGPTGNYRPEFKLSDATFRGPFRNILKWLFRRVK